MTFPTVQFKLASDSPIFDGLALAWMGDMVLGENDRAKEELADFFNRRIGSYLASDPIDKEATQALKVVVEGATFTAEVVDEDKKAITETEDVIIEGSQDD